MTVYNNPGVITLSMPNSDAALWADMKRGNENALARLYKSYVTVLQKHGRRFCKDRELVSDSIHELFSRLWTRREHIGAADNVKVYLYRSLERIILAQLLRTKREKLQLVDDIPSLDSFEQFTIDKELRKQQLTAVRACLSSLPKCQREVILLKFFNNLSYVEISEIMDLELASVYNLVSKAMEQLRQKMQINAITA